MTARQKVIWWWLPLAFFVGNLIAKFSELRGAWQLTSELVALSGLIFYACLIVFSAGYRRELVSLMKTMRLPEEK